ncbi:MAG: hypothetical protein ACPLUL_01385 [Thermanaerothrix sp.]|jgi:hypothetical protein|uniref:Uncharacterized protein n=1 Tax=Thermanaerothrix solaris TaxID=3058434 RepID=A0ABU3NJ44_9CHLR|nr:hypothetical protein [Thermanaerothrix sp. 4228-RoL]MDT8896870.1 hypothetical protein [Thermanaerothrix sp. 4228-RoL]
MDAQTLHKVCRQIYNRFPQVEGQKPKIKPQTEEIFLLIFESRATSADGKSHHQIVRATVTKNGKILKTSLSR